jgi:hypothetical protein
MRPRMLGGGGKPEKLGVVAELGLPQQKKREKEWIEERDERIVW